MAKKEIYLGHQDKEIDVQYVKIVNPIVLGIQIAIGMFVVFPLFVMVLFVVFGGLLAVS